MKYTIQSKQELDKSIYARKSAELESKIIKTRKEIAVHEANYDYYILRSYTEKSQKAKQLRNEAMQRLADYKAEYQKLIDLSILDNYFNAGLKN